MKVIIFALLLDLIGEYILRLMAYSVYFLSVK